VIRTGSLAQATSAQWAVAGAGGGGTMPAAASDFAGGVLPGGTVVIAAGQSSQMITVAVAADATIELNERFAVTLSSPILGAVITTATAEDVILNDDASLSIAPAAASKDEGNTGSTAFTFTVTRTGASTGAASAKWSVAGSGAAAASATDFAGGALPGGTVSFAAGETSRTITVNVAGDTLVEVSEGFTVMLADPSNATLGTATAAGTILTDDTTCRLRPRPPARRRETVAALRSPSRSPVPG